MLQSCASSGTSRALSLVDFSSALPSDRLTKPGYENCRNPFSLADAKPRLRSIAGESQHQQKQFASPARTFAQVQITEVKPAKNVFQFFSNKNGMLEAKGTVLLQRKNLLGLNDQGAEILDAASELLLGKRVALQLVSLDVDPETGEGKRSRIANLDGWIFKPDPLLADKGTFYSVTFQLEKDFGVPGALLVSNQHPNEFFLKTITLDMPDKTEIHFNCNSWIYSEKAYSGPRIFFSNQVYLPKNTPAGLQKLRAVAMKELRGDGTGERKASDRQYDYDVYNDLGKPDKSKELSRTILGASKEFPYPRRCRTGRKPNKHDPATESPVSALEDVYVPRDEKFGRQKESDFLCSSIKSFAEDIIPTIEDTLENNDDFKSLKELEELYTKGLDLSKCRTSAMTKEKKSAQFKAPLALINELTHPDLKDTGRLKYPEPQVMRGNKTAWLLDEEFARQMIAGMNPMMIQRLETFPPVSNLDEKIYGSPTSAITEKHILDKLGGLTVEQALAQNKLFILDYHDAYLPYIDKINSLDGKAYASRTILFLTEQDALKPVAIELSLPPSPTSGGNCIRRVFTPPHSNQEDYLWRLAKTHVKTNDSGYHQLISHWLRTHACLEPFIIASNRQLSALHPIHTLLTPHFKNTLNINAMARKSLINAAGIIENNFTPGKYSMEVSSAGYKSWRFDKEGLPADLINRGMAVQDETAKHGLRLVIQDYPYAVDGLEIWFAILSWVRDYVRIYYQNDRMVEEDTELQSWWKEIKEIGHGDKREEPWWFEMKSREDLEQTMVTIIWLASAHHAAVNFGQYAYAGLPTNKPTKARKLIPLKGTPEYLQFLEDPNAYFLQTIPKVPQATIIMTTTQILSQHSSDEEYLGQRPHEKYWTNHPKVDEAFNRFASRINDVEREIDERNMNPHFRNRCGPAIVPYTLLHPSSEKGLTGRGVPNSVSI